MAARLACIVPPMAIASIMSLGKMSRQIDIYLLTDCRSGGGRSARARRKGGERERDANMPCEHAEFFLDGSPSFGYTFMLRPSGGMADAAVSKTVV